jgi:hypothetical protein
MLSTVMSQTHLSRSTAGRTTSLLREVFLDPLDLPEKGGVCSNAPLFAGELDGGFETESGRFFYI